MLRTTSFFTKPSQLQVNLGSLNLMRGVSRHPDAKLMLYMRFLASLSFFFVRMELKIEKKHKFHFSTFFTQKCSQRPYFPSIPSETTRLGFSDPKLTLDQLGLCEEVVGGTISRFFGKRSTFLVILAYFGGVAENSQYLSQFHSKLCGKRYFDAVCCLKNCFAVFEITFIELSDLILT